jgi:hypothetical protein
MQEGQDWCLQCGAGKSGSLVGGPGWRTGGAILAATVLLVVGASVAAYAALTKPKPKPKVVAVARRPLSSTPSTTVPGTGSGALPSIPTTVSPAPKIPTPAPTPAPTSASKGSEAGPVFPEETNTGTSGNTSSTNASTEAGKGSEEGKEKTESQSGSEPPSPILLDTNAASVYNPYSYPATLFGDPSLTIDGEGKTAWTAQVQPEKAPNMAEGLLLDLKTPQKLGNATVKSTTTGATVEVYGANGAAPAASITDPAWVRLVGLKKLKKKDTNFKLKTKGKSYRFVVLWLVKAPPGSTAAKPGAVAIDEFELFPPS